MTTNLTKFEAVDGALAALLLAGEFMDSADPRGWIRKENALVDACIGAGMDYDHADLIAWASEFVTTQLLAA